MEDLAIADAKAEEEKEKQKEGDEQATSAPQAELCSMSELMEVLDEFYQGDKQDMGYSANLVSSSKINAPVNINAKEFDLDFASQSDQLVSLPNIDFGSSNEMFSVEDLI